MPSAVASLCELAVPSTVTEGTFMAVSITLGNNPNTLTLNTVDLVIGGTASDLVTMSGDLTGATIDLGAGTDTLQLFAGTNSLTAINIESIRGSTAADVLTLNGAVSGTTTVDLGSGNDTL